MADTRNIARKSLTAALVRIHFTGIPDNYKLLQTSTDNSGNVTGDVATIARAQQLSTNDALPYARIRQIGYPTIVEDVPLFMEGQGNLSAIETIDGASLYLLGIYDFVHFILNCSRTALDIALVYTCGGGRTSSNSSVETAAGEKPIDVLPNCKFISVARSIDVNGQLVMDSAAFYYIRPLSEAPLLPNIR